MRALTAVVVVAALIWGGYWFIGSRTVEKAARDWFATEAALGRDISYNEISLAGFPSRFDLTVTEPAWRSPYGFGWRAPFVQVFSLSYKPWHVIFALPEHQFDTPFETITITPGKLGGSLVAEPAPPLPFDRLAVVGEDMIFASTRGWTARAKTVRLAARQAGGRDNSYQLALDATDITSDPVLAVQADAPVATGQLHIEAEIGLTAPLDRHASVTLPAITDLTLTALSLEWDTVLLSGTGTLVPDADGFASGQIDLTLTDWRSAIAPAVTFGLIAPELADTWESMLAIMAAQSPDPQRLTVPLIFRNGRISIGPLPLGPAPRLR